MEAVVIDFTDRVSPYLRSPPTTQMPDTRTGIIVSAVLACASTLERRWICVAASPLRVSGCTYQADHGRCDTAVSCAMPGGGLRAWEHVLSSSGLSQVKPPWVEAAYIRVADYIPREAHGYT